MKIATLQQLDPVHDNVAPMEVRNGYGILGTMSIDGKDISSKVLRLSPIGAEFEVAAGSIATSPGSDVDVSLKFNDQLLHTRGIVVCWSEEQRQKGSVPIVGIRWLHQRVSESGENQREKRRWPCNELFLPSVVAPNPLNYEDLVFFRAVDLSADGALLVTSLRNKFVVAGTRFKGVFTFPITGAYEAEFEVRWQKVKESGQKSELHVGISFISEKQILRKIMGEYIAHFGDDVDIAELRDNGFVVHSMKKSIQVKYARSKEDFEAVIKLRQLAYESYKEGTGEIKEMFDVYDSRSRVIVGLHKGKCVASCRISFHDHQDTPEVYDKLDLPDNLVLKNHELVEISRLCVDPGYRSTDIFFGIIKEGMIVALQAKRRYMIASAPDHLEAPYKSLGFVFHNYSFSPKSCPNLNLRYIVIDLAKLISGDGVSPSVWNSFYAPLLSMAVERGVVSLNVNAKIKMLQNRMLAKLPTSKTFPKLMTPFTGKEKKSA